MALDAVIYPQDPFSTYGCSDFYSMGGAAWWGYDLALKEEDKALLGILDASWDSSSPSVMQSFKDCDPNSSPEAACADDQSFTGLIHPPPATTTGRRKRRRTKSSRNKEDVENQRMTHIAVERNRRKQMNEYLAVLRSLMPPSYVQRGDQASIIGGAINFVKELEQLLQFMEGDKTTKQETESWVSSNSPLAQFFIFPQYSTRAAENESTAAAAADIEVTMVESHANLKILSRKQPGQLLKMVAAFQTLRLTILHLNVTTVDQMVLYSVSVKVEEGSQLNTVDEIAAAVNQMLRRMQEEAAFT